jgi:peptide/nickel transport system substrate-binding protein
VISKLSIRAAALAVAAALVIGACGSSTTGSVQGPGFDRASSQILNPAGKGDGTVRIVTSSANLDSIDPGQTYSAPTWNLYRAFIRTVLAFKHEPGAAGAKLVGDLATGPGEVAKDGKTWTYTIRDGATFEDGKPITSQDIAWAIERSGWSQAVSGGPTYFYTILTPPGSKYEKWDVFKDGPLGKEVIDYTDPHKLVFHLPKPFGEFDFLMTTPATAPVPYMVDAKDAAAAYSKKPVASGAYKIQTWDPGKELKLVRNDAYNAKSDPELLHVANAAALDLQLGVDPAERDQRLLDGQADIDFSSSLTVANHAKVLSDPALKSQIDDSVDGSLVYGSINFDVVPNLDCRQAIELGVNKDAVLNELGGPYGGTKATNLVPDAIPGHSSFDLYTYDPDKAKAALAKCRAASPGDPNFDKSTGRYKFVLATQTNSPDLANAATAMQASLKGVGIDIEVQLYPFYAYSTQYCGNAPFAKYHHLGVCLGIWGADWPTGYGFLDQLITRHGILPNGGSSNWSNYTSPAVDQLEEQALATSDASAQQKLWAQIDHKAMEDAAVIPLIQRKVLRFRSAKLTNVMIDTASGGGYDLPMLGVKS